MVTKTKKKVYRLYPKTSPRAHKLAKIYAIAAVLILLATTLLWTILGANLQQNNSDELANPYLFESLKTSHQATLPGAHSFLIKWPLFYLIKLFGFSTGSYIALTVLAVLATIGILVIILYRIERRPVFFGTLCLALASVLLMVPSQPVAGALLPLNMAMLASRNLEYAIYLGALLLFAKSVQKRGWHLWLSSIVLGILIASDKLFLILPLCAAVLALCVYTFRRKWRLAGLFSGWLLVALVAALIGTASLVLINRSGFVHISDGSNGSPYTFVSSSKNLALGILYAAMGIATNFGANPAYGSTVVRHVPHQFFAGLFSLGGPAYLVNIVILLAGLVLALRLVKNSLSKKRPFDIDKNLLFSLALVWSLVAAVGIFIAGAHYYAVDARYLTIGLFTLFIIAATMVRGTQWPQKRLMAVGGVITFGICFGVVSNVHTYNNQLQALQPTNERNSLVAQALKHHPVDTLVGDYWRVLPIRSESNNTLRVTPLQDCTTPSQTLSSQNWQPNLKTHSFAYLLSLDPSLTNFPQCNLKQALAKYGTPNSSILIAGSFNRPKELLLIYDHGIHFAKHSAATGQTPATILPVNLSDLTNTSCPVPTDMNIVAHQDDDLLFMNPDISNDIKQGYCIRTVYITAGDAGSDQYYWLGREQGSEAAYEAMLGKPVVWQNHIIKITDSEYINIANPRGNNSISLIFVHLPDGGLKGTGFKNTGFESLQKMETGKIKTMQSVDHQSTYSESDLVTLLTALMHIYQPTQIRTQSDYNIGQFIDHPDHIAVGNLVKPAYARYEQQQFNDRITIPLSFYIGYPIHGMAINVTSDVLQSKVDTFLTYAKFDGGVCQTPDQCYNSSAYGAYLSRQYTNGQ